VTIGNFAGTAAVAILIVLSQAGDGRRETARPASSAVVSETTRPEPVPTKEVEPPRTVETAPARPKPPQVAAPATPRPPTAAPKPPAVAAGPPAPRQNEPPRAEPVPEQSPPAPQSPAPPESMPPPSTETAPPETTAAQPAKPTAVTLDLTALEQRLRDTKAIGVFTKLSLKNQVDDLLDEFREFHQSRDQTMLAKLRQAFDLLVLKVLSLLQDGDPTLARDVSSSREALWRILIDPDRFRNL
jgi:hypothetical protein